MILPDAYQNLDNAMRACLKCATLLGGKCVDPLKSDKHVDPRPIVSGIRPKPIMLIGQAPGITEYATGQSFKGDAGQEIRGVFDEVGVSRSRFDECVYSSAVVKCFPGSKRVANRRKAGFRREDEIPSVEMVSNCQPFFEEQIRLADPQVIVTLGGFPLKAYLKLTGRKAIEARLEHFIGKKESWNGRTVIFLPHTSGTSRWLNSNENRRMFQQAKALLRSELIERGITNP
jgi:uracil-DNA glycosylase family 4